MQQRIEIAPKGFRVGEKSAFLRSADMLWEKVKITMEEFSSSAGASVLPEFNKTNINLESICFKRL